MGHPAKGDSRSLRSAEHKSTGEMLVAGAVRKKTAGCTALSTVLSELRCGGRIWEGHRQATRCTMHGIGFMEVVECMARAAFVWPTRVDNGLHHSEIALVSVNRRQQREGGGGAMNAIRIAPPAFLGHQSIFSHIYATKSLPSSRALGAWVWVWGREGVFVAVAGGVGRWRGGQFPACLISQTF